MASRINPTLFDKLAADLEIQALREEGEDAPAPIGEAASSALRFYSVPRIERFNEAALRNTVRRELNWLLNTTSLAAAEDLSDCPEVRTSVLNYGVPDFTGKTLERRVVQAHAREMREAIRAFEPRLDPQRLDVEVLGSDELGHAITFVIRGDVVSAVNALPVEFKTDVELDTGIATVRD